MRFVALVVLLVCACSVHVGPVPPTGVSNCSTACTNQRQLACGLDLTNCEADCGNPADGNQWPVDCLTAAKTCEELGNCK
jgi:hypothetical protein